MPVPWLSASISGATEVSPDAEGRGPRSAAPGEKTNRAWPDLRGIGEVGPSVAILRRPAGQCDATGGLTDLLEGNCGRCETVSGSPRTGSRGEARAAANWR